MNKSFRYLTIFFLFVILFSNVCFAENGDSTDVKKEYGRIQYQTREFKTNLDQLDEKFNNLNVNSAYEELNKMIYDNENNDYYLMILADKATNFGFFDLAKIAFSKISDLELVSIDADNTRKLFFPKVSMDKDDIVFLAEAYSNILHNDRNQEAVVDVLSRFSGELNDYADYILAMAYLDLNDVDNAQKYIRHALEINPNNLNYKILQSKIIANLKRNKKALKIVKYTKSEKIGYYPIRKAIDANEQYVMYKVEKQPFMKDYHLGYYYYLMGEDSKSLRILQSAISKNNSRNALLYSLMSRVYVRNGEYDKAKAVATKAYNYNLSNVNTLLSLGDIAFDENKYKQALKYYKQAAKSSSSASDVKLKLADTYAKLNNTKTSNSMYKKIMNKDALAYKAYYQVGLSNPDIELTYLKKAVAINPNFTDGWIDLSRIMIENGNYTQAKKYLENAYYLDGNDFRYYYYQSLLMKKLNELNRMEKRL
jgi:tetratricopeptide (TPR) repeat protein